MKLVRIAKIDAHTLQKRWRFQGSKHISDLQVLWCLITLKNLTERAEWP